MDIRTWQDADRADDARAAAAGPGSQARPSYRARHRSSRSPFSPLRPGPIAIGSLSTAAVAAVALVSPHLLQTDTTVSASPAIDGRAVPAGHIGPRTPGPAGTTSTAPSGDQGPAATAGPTGGPTAPAASPSAGPSTAVTGTKQAPTHQPTGLATSAVPTSSAPSDPAGGSVDVSRTDPGAPAPSSSAPAGPAPSSQPSSAPSTPSAPPSTPPGPPPTTTTSAPAVFNAAAAQLSALTEIAAVRHTNNICQLNVDATLSTLAAQHNGDMVKHRYFAHTGSDGSSPQGRAYRVGYWPFGQEIIARGAPGADVIATLLADPVAGHELTWGWYSTVGVSAQQDPATGQVLWTIELGWG